MAMEQLEGRVAVVTGAGSGSGRALAVRFADEGLQVVAADIEAGPLDETASVVPGEVLPVVTDVADPASVEALAAAAYDRFGAVHVVCNNAGVFQAGLVWQRTVADWEWVLGVNLWGVIHGVNAFVPRMLAGGDEGHIVNTSSLAGVVTNAYSGPYHVSKFGVVALSESLAHDLAAQQARIGVSVLCPGSVATRIGRSERNRPPRLAEGVEAEDATFVNQALIDMTDNVGVPPAKVAGQVVDAIRAGQFYVPTSPGFDEQVRRRAEQILKKEAPYALPFDA